MYSRENASQCIDSRNSVGPASQTEERKRSGHWVTVVCRGFRYPSHSFVECGYSCTVTCGSFAEFLRRFAPFRRIGIARVDR